MYGDPPPPLLTSTLFLRLDTDDFTAFWLRCVSQSLSLERRGGEEEETGKEPGEHGSP